MSISIGKSKINHRSLVIYPSNKGTAQLAQERMKQVVGQANRRHHEALLVDPLKLHVWIKQRSGNYCSCYGPNATNHDTSDSTTDHSVISDHLAYGDSLELEHNRQQRVNGSYVPLSPEEQDVNALLEAKYGKISMSETELSEYDMTSTIDADIMDAIDDNLSVHEQQLVKQLKNSSLTGGDKTKCGICFGTGYRDGYQLFNGQRIVLDALNYKQTDCSLNKNDRPWSLQGPGYVLWEIEAPTYFSKCVVRARNNTQTADYAVVEALVGGIWVTVDENFWMVRNGLNNKLLIRAKIKNIFTHLELIFELGDLPLGNMPNLNKSTQWEIFDVLMNQQMEIEATVQGLDRECVVVENKFGYVWKVVDCERLSTSFGQTFNWNVNVRLVQNYEQLYLLKLIQGNLDLKDANYTVLERQQGIPGD